MLSLEVPFQQVTVLQEFVELVRQAKTMQAIKYARGHLSPWASVYMPELQVFTAHKTLHNKLQ